MGQNNSAGMVSGEIPRTPVIGSAIKTAKEPFIVNTVKIMSI